VAQQQLGRVKFLFKHEQQITVPRRWSVYRISCERLEHDNTKGKRVDFWRYKSVFALRRHIEERANNVLCLQVRCRDTSSNCSRFTNSKVANAPNAVSVEQNVGTLSVCLCMCVCVCARVCVRVHALACVCVRERDSVCMRETVCVSV